MVYVRNSIGLLFTDLRMFAYKVSCETRGSVKHRSANALRTMKAEPQQQLNNSANTMGNQCKPCTSTPFVSTLAE